MLPFMFPYMEIIDKYENAIQNSRFREVWKNGNFVIEVSLAGFKEEDLDISIRNDGEIRIKGKNEERSVDLCYKIKSNYDPKKVELYFNNGLLKIVTKLWKPEEENIKLKISKEI